MEEGSIGTEDAVGSQTTISIIGTDMESLKKIIIIFKKSITLKT